MPGLLAFPNWHIFCYILAQEESIFVMSILNLRNTLKGLAFASVFALGLILFSGTTASAQYGGYYPNNGGYYGRDNDRYRRNERKDYERGYKQGYKDGKNDARNRRGSYGRNGNNGRYGGYGNNGRYGGYGNNAYQAGYDRGYREGYDRNRRNRRNGSIFGWPLPY
jgi:hypothetical protein